MKFPLLPIDENADRRVDALVAKKLAGVTTKPLRRKAMNREKVYCKNCAYFKCMHDPWYGDWCDNPHNIQMKDTYHGIARVYIEKPAERNADNDCCWFALKWWRRMLKCLGI